MLRRLNTKQNAPINIETKEDYRAGLQELNSDINQITSQWNSFIYPLLDSLPGGRTRLRAEQRSDAIDPSVNGFDGSQVFMDMTATPQFLRGLFYSNKNLRPKTIKEVVLDNYGELTGELNRLKVLFNNLEDSSDIFDDTSIKNWVRRLAANTVSDLELGAEFPSAYFAGNLPTKTVQYSLHQRDANLRTLIGVSSADFSLTNPGFDGTNYIDDDDILEALLDLDAALGNIDPGATTLQQAYNNGDGTIVITDVKPLNLQTAADDDYAILLRGYVQLLHATGAGVGAIYNIGTEYSSDLFTLNLYRGGIGPSATSRSLSLVSDADLNSTVLHLGHGQAAAEIRAAQIAGGKDSGGNSVWRLGTTSGSITTELHAIEDFGLYTGGGLSLTSVGLTAISALAIVQESGYNTLKITGLFRADDIAIPAFLITDDADAEAFSLKAKQNLAVNNLNTAPASLSIATVGATYNTGYAPAGRYDADGDPLVSYTSGFGVSPVIGTTYKDNTIKASGTLSLADVKSGTISHAEAAQRFNIKVDYEGENDVNVFSYYTEPTGKIRYLTPVESIYEQSITYGVVSASNSSLHTVTIYDVLTTGFSFRIREWDDVNSTWIGPTEAVKFCFQVV